MRIGSGEQTYEWIGDWGAIPESSSARRGWAHPGMAATAADEIITFHQGDPTMLVFSPDGALLRSFETGLTEGHGITLAREGETDYLWIADSGSKRLPELDYQYPPGDGGRVVKMTLDGNLVLTLERPPLPVYATGKYSPTAVAVNEERHGGNGDIWVADGYGQSQVHRYSRFSKQGEYLGSIDGREGSAGAFACPHSIWIDWRKAEPELYVADRSNHRIQVYDLNGVFKRVVGADFLLSPSAFARQDDCLIVAELHARLTVLDADDRLICYLGWNETVAATDGWPNMKGPDGVPMRTTRLEEGAFNSPHGVAVDSAGNIYVAEWLIGGRMTKLAKV